MDSTVGRERIEHLVVVEVSFRVTSYYAALNISFQVRTNLDAYFVVRKEPE